MQTFRVSRCNWVIGASIGLLSCFTSGSFADENVGAEAVIAAGRQSNQVQVHLDYLTNRIGPRLTGSRGLQNACEWAKGYFTELGLSNSRLEQWGEFPVGFDRGPAFGKMVEPKEMQLNFATNAWTAGTKGNVSGYAFMAPTTSEELELIRPKLEGAFVLMPRAQRGRGPFRRGEGGPSDAATQAKSIRPPQLEQPLGLGEVESTQGGVDGKQSTSSIRSSDAGTKLDPTKIRETLLQCKIGGFISSTTDELLLTGGSFQVDWNKLPTTPSILLQKSQFDEIAAILKEKKEVKLGFDIRNHFFKGPVPLYNVIADLPGTELPDEYVIVGGHIDSWDGATGATDNAAGCSTTMEAARILIAAGVKPKRTIRFMLWSGEEQGLMGSIGYVEKNKELMSKISAVLVHDGGTNYVAGIGGTEPMLPLFEKVFAPAKSLDPKAPFEVRKVDQILPRGGSDHVSFIQAGVPGFFWDQRGRATYRNTHHTQYDTYDTIVPEYQEHSSIVIALGALGIANLDELLPRDGVRRGR